MFIIVRNCEHDSDNEVKIIESIFKKYNIKPKIEVQTESYSSDYYVSGGLQAIDITIDYIRYDFDDQMIFDKLNTIFDPCFTKKSNIQFNRR